MSVVVLRGLTLWQPWAWSIVSGPKRIENRPWRPWRGVTHVAVHAGLTYDREGEAFLAALGIHPPAEAHLSSAVLGVARIAGCYSTDEPLVRPPADQERFLFGPYGWLLDDVVALDEPVGCRGARGLWVLPPDVEARVLPAVHVRSRP